MQLSETLPDSPLSATFRPFLPIRGESMGTLAVLAGHLDGIRCSSISFALTSHTSEPVAGYSEGTSSPVERVYRVPFRPSARALTASVAFTYLADWVVVSPYVEVSLHLLSDGSQIGDSFEEGLDTTLITTLPHYLGTRFNVEENQGDLLYVKVRAVNAALFSITVQEAVQYEVEDP